MKAKKVIALVMCAAMVAGMSASLLPRSGTVWPKL